MTVIPSQYPISQLIHKIRTDSGLSRHNFALAVGYKNATGGLKTMDSFLRQGSGDPFFIRGVLHRFPERHEEVRAAIAETSRIKKHNATLARIEAEKKARKDFRPYILVETSLTRPTFITAAALCGFSMRYIHFKENRPHTQQEIAETVKGHYERNKGKCMLFGDITGYRFVKTFDESLLMDIEGNVLENKPGYVEPLSGGLKINGKNVSSEEAKAIIGWEPGSNLD